MKARTIIPPKPQEAEASGLEFGEQEGQAAEPSAEPLSATPSTQAEVESPPAESPAVEAPPPAVEEQPKKEETGTTASDLLKNVPQHPLTTPTTSVGAGNHAMPERGFVLVCKSCAREITVRAQNASRLPGVCSACGGPLLSVAEVP